MKVTINFELDLSKLFSDNKDHIFFEGRSEEGIIEELKEIFPGKIEEGLSMDCKTLYEHEFINLFDY